MVEQRGLCSKIESFCCGCFCLIARVLRSMHGYLEIKSFVVDAFLATLRIFHSTCNFDIVRLNNEVLLPTEQILNFNQPDDKEFHFWQEIVKFYKFKSHPNFSYQILLPHKAKAVKNLCKKHFKAIKTARIFTRKTKFHLPNLASY